MVSDEERDAVPPLSVSSSSTGTSGKILSTGETSSTSVESSSISKYDSSSKQENGTPLLTRSSAALPINPVDKKINSRKAELEAQAHLLGKQSRRLVEYFLVVSCVPEVKKLQAKNSANDEEKKSDLNDQNKPNEGTNSFEISDLVGNENDNNNKPKASSKRKIMRGLSKLGSKSKIKSNDKNIEASNSSSSIPPPPDTDSPISPPLLNRTKLSKDIRNGLASSVIQENNSNLNTPQNQSIKHISNSSPSNNNTPGNQTSVRPSPHVLRRMDSRRIHLPDTPIRGGDVSAAVNSDCVATEARVPALPLLTQDIPNNNTSEENFSKEVNTTRNVAAGSYIVNASEFRTQEIDDGDVIDEDHFGSSKPLKKIHGGTMKLIRKGTSTSIKKLKRIPSKLNSSKLNPLKKKGHKDQDDIITDTCEYESKTSLEFQSSSQTNDEEVTLPHVGNFKDMHESMGRSMLHSKNIYDDTDSSGDGGGSTIELKGKGNTSKAMSLLGIPKQKDAGDRLDSQTISSFDEDKITNPKTDAKAVLRQLSLQCAVDESNLNESIANESQPHKNYVENVPPVENIISSLSIPIDDDKKKEIGAESFCIKDNNVDEKLDVVVENNTVHGASQNIYLPDCSDESDKCLTSKAESDLKFNPVVTARYPLNDHEDNKLNPMVTHFCYPNTDELNLTTSYRMPRIHHFVLTNDKGNKLYGTCLTVYEEFDPHPTSDKVNGTEDIKIHNTPTSSSGDNKLKNATQQKGSGVTNRNRIHIGNHESHNHGIEVSYGPDTPVECKSSMRKRDHRTQYLPKVLCLLSTWPYLHAFREYLSQLYKLTTMTKGVMSAPLERYILNICEEIPAPPPGSFELQLAILNSTIRFWAPPANQPISYVALPFNVLFECLDIDKVIYVWYALTLERKVLLVSSQYSLPVLCAEILCSLLFPMQWSHLYIPLLPRFLCPMLDAPMPYLCGITRDNLAYAIGFVSDETIMVDLDTNVITWGDNVQDIPAISFKRRTKLENALEKNAGDVYWNARGTTKAQKDAQDAEMFVSDQMKNDEINQVWKEKLESYDDAFNLAYTPDSPALLNGDSQSTSPRNKSVDGFNEQSRWDAVQEAFLRFYVSMLQEYQRFLTKLPDKSKDEEKSLLNTRWANDRTFRTKEFVKAQREDFHPFLNEFCMTQQFDDFITKRMYNPDEPDIIFFNQSITAKNNRSKMTLTKKQTPFLNSTNAHKTLSIIDAIKPNTDNIPGNRKFVKENDGKDNIGTDDLFPIFPPSSLNLLDQLYASPTTPSTKVDTHFYSYDHFPEKFDKNLFGKARPMPAIISAEYDRRAALSLRLSQNHDGNESVEGDFRSGDCNPHPEVATFTVFFVLFSKSIGHELAEIRQRQLLKEIDVEEKKIAHVHNKNKIETELRERNKNIDIDHGDDVNALSGSNCAVNGNKLSTANDNLSDALQIVPDCSIDVCSSCDWNSTMGSESNVQTNNSFINLIFGGSDEEESSKVPSESSNVMLHTESDRYTQLNDEDLEEATIISNAHLDLAFSALDMMLKRKLRADPDACRALMDACGRCGQTQRATQLMVLLREGGFLIDSEMYSTYLGTFSASEILYPNKPIELPLSQTSIDSGNGKWDDSSESSSRNSIGGVEVYLSKRKTFFPRKSKTRRPIEVALGPKDLNSPSKISLYSDSFDHESDHGSIVSSVAETSISSYRTGKWLSPSWPQGIQKSMRSKTQFKIKSPFQRKSKLKLTKKIKLLTTDQVEQHNNISESLLDILYPDLKIDASSDACPKCSRILSEDDVIVGWKPCSFQDYNTSCPQCKHRFVPRFIVSTSSSKFLGSQGFGTPLYCEFLSPWVLRKALFDALIKNSQKYGGNGINAIIDPNWRSGTDINSTLWWNMIVSFRRYKLPFTFLLQGSVRNKLFMPTSD